MEIYCNLSSETIEKAYQDYNKHVQTDLMRISGIDPAERYFLWRLWILAIMYQAMREETSEKTFRGIPKDGLVFDPSRISQIALKCNCKFLQSANRVHFCDFKSGGCSQNESTSDCPLPMINNEIHRLPRISKEILSSAIFLRQYDFEFTKLYQSLLGTTIGERTQKILDMFMVLAGEKIAHLYLGWVSDNNLIKDSWTLDAKKFLAVDTNIKRVTRNIGLCQWSNTNVIRAYLNQLLDELGMNDSKDPKKLEMAFLYVGQEYCQRKNLEKCMQTKCPFYPLQDSQTS